MLGIYLAGHNPIKSIYLLDIIEERLGFLFLCTKFGNRLDNGEFLTTPAVEKHCFTG